MLIKMMRQSVVLLAVLVGLYAPFGLAKVYQEGTHYKRLDAATAIPRKPGQKPVVEELFWYGCPHCHHLEPMIRGWVTAHKDAITFTPIPVFFGNQWKAHAQLFYTLETLGWEREVRSDIFNAIAQGRSLTNADEDAAYLAPYLKKHHVTAEQFEKTYNGYKVLSQLKISAQKAKAYQLTGVPAFVVNGTYFTDVGMAKSEQDLLGILNQLIAIK